MQALESPLTFPKSSFSKFSVKPRFHFSEKKPNLDSPDTLPQSDIAELFFSVWQHHEMTDTNRQRLKFALLSYHDLNESDYRIIDRIFHAVKRGWIKVID
ncbi:MAG: hypothetical protein ACRC8Y_01715 [Chroococcales cyanobacterium]